MQFPLVTQVIGSLSRAFGTARRYIPLLGPYRKEAFIVLENPHDEERDREFGPRKEALVDQVVSKFKTGHDIVVVNIGHPPTFADVSESFLSGRSSWQGAASVLLTIRNIAWDGSRTDPLEVRTGRVLQTFQGIKKAGSNVIRCFHEDGPYDDDAKEGLPLEGLHHISDDRALALLFNAPRPTRCLEGEDTLYTVLVDLRKVERENLLPDSYAQLVIEDQAVEQSPALVN